MKNKSGSYKGPLYYKMSLDTIKVSECGLSEMKMYNDMVLSGGTV